MLLEFLLLAGAIAAASKIVSESYVFEWLRNRVARFNVHLGEGISCQLCTGAWAGLLAAAFAPTFIPIDPHGFAWFADGMALAFVGRLLYSVQEVVLASSFWLERNNCPVEGDYPTILSPIAVLDEAKEIRYTSHPMRGIFGTGGIDVSGEQEATSLTLEEIGNMLGVNAEKILEFPEKETPQEQSLIETDEWDGDWKEDWRNLPDESEELA